MLSFFLCLGETQGTSALLFLRAAQTFILLAQHLIFLLQAFNLAALVIVFLPQCQAFEHELAAFTAPVIIAGLQDSTLGANLFATLAASQQPFWLVTITAPSLLASIVAATKSNVHAIVTNALIAALTQIAAGFA